MQNALSQMGRNAPSMIKHNKNAATVLVSNCYIDIGIMRCTILSITLRISGWLHICVLEIFVSGTRIVGLCSLAFRIGTAVVHPNPIIVMLFSTSLYLYIAALEV